MTKCDSLMLLNQKQNKIKETEILYRA